MLQKQDETQLLVQNYSSLCFAVSAFRLSKIPSYILLENVKGFETSLTRDVTVKTLEKLDFVFQVLDFLRLTKARHNSHEDNAL